MYCFGLFGSQGAAVSEGGPQAVDGNYTWRSRDGIVCSTYCHGDASGGAQGGYSRLLHADLQAALSVPSRRHCLCSPATENERVGAGVMGRNVRQS